MAEQPAMELQSAFTPRQREILDLYAMGYTTHEICLRLRIGADTVKTHKKRMFAHTGARTTLQLVAMRVAEMTWEELSEVKSERSQLAKHD